MTIANQLPREGELGLHGWHGLTWQRVRVVGETAKRYRIEAIERTRLAGRSRSLAPGERALVPKTAVRLLPSEDT